MAIITVSTEALKEEDYPLFSQSDQEEKVFRMSDAMALQQLANS